MTQSLTPASEPKKDNLELNLSPEAQTYLNEQNLSEQDQGLLMAFVYQQLRQSAFWNSDVSTSDSELNRIALETVVTLEEMRRGMEDIVEPDKRAKRLFIK